MDTGIAVRTRRPWRASRFALAFVAGTLALAGCSGQPSVDSAWNDKASARTTFQRVLVVGISPDYDQRCAFEASLRGQLRSEHTAAFTSCDSMRADEKLTREAIERVVAAKQADAVIATRLVATKATGREGGTRDTRGHAMYKATDTGWAYGYGYYGTYGVPVVYGEFEATASVFSLTGEVDVASQVFETKGATDVYAMQTKAKGLETREVALLTLAGTIADRLRRDGVVR